MSLNKGNPRCLLNVPETLRGQTLFIFLLGHYPYMRLFFSFHWHHKFPPSLIYYINTLRGWTRYSTGQTSVRLQMPRAVPSWPQPIPVCPLGTVNPSVPYSPDQEAWTNAPPQDNKLLTVRARLSSFVSLQFPELLWPKYRVWHLRKGGAGQGGCRQSAYLSSASGIRSAHCQHTLWKNLMGRHLAKRQSSKPSVHVLLRPPTGYLAIWPNTKFSSSVFEPRPSLAWLDWTDPLSNTIIFFFFI